MIAASDGSAGDLDEASDVGRRWTRSWPIALWMSSLVGAVVVAWTSSTPESFPLVPLLVLSLFWPVAGLTWLVCAYQTFRHHAKHWIAIIVAPSVFVGSLVLARSTIPFDIRWHYVVDDFDRFVKQLPAEEPTGAEWIDAPAELGGLDVPRARRTSDGVFFTLDTSFDSETGVAFLPNGPKLAIDPLADHGRMQVGRSLGDSWFEFDAYVPFD